jgi:cation diffusion facilitator family transporter
MVGERFPVLSFLHHADAVAAIGVALIVVYVSGQLVMRTVQALLDVAPIGLEKKITTVVEALPGVNNCHDVRMRYSGSQLFVDIHVLIDGNQTLKDAHHLTEEIEQAIQKIVPKADIIVHPEPNPEPDDH